MNFKPLNDRLLVKRIEPEQKTAGGLFIPDSAKEKPLEGIVTAVGTGKALKSGVRRAPPVAAGNRILFGKYSGDEIKLDDVEHVVLREDEVLAIIED